MPDQIILNPKPTLLQPNQLSPINLTHGFKDSDIVCFHHDLAPIEGASSALSPIAPYGAYTRKDGLGIKPTKMKEMSRKPLMILAYLAGSLRDIPPFIYTAQEMDADFNALFRVYYYRSCTVVSWASVTQGALFLNESMDDDYAPYSPSEILATVYAPMHESNHDELAHIEQLSSDLKAHAEILSSEYPGISLGVIRDS
jgi:hypothetical protein